MDNGPFEVSFSPLTVGDCSDFTAYWNHSKHFVRSNYSGSKDGGWGPTQLYSCVLLYITKDAGQEQSTDITAKVQHRWGSFSCVLQRVRGVFSFDSWSWSGAFTTTIVSAANEGKSLNHGRNLLLVCDGDLAWFQHFNISKERRLIADRKYIKKQKRKRIKNCFLFRFLTNTYCQVFVTIM